MFKNKLRSFMFKTALGYAVYKSCKLFYNILWILLTVFNYYVVKYRGIITHCYANKKLHLGCGENYLEGWINIDNYIGKQRKKDLWLDITNGLPFGSSEIDAIFTSHTLEHFVYWDVVRVLRECYRVLGPNKIMRIAVPSMTLAFNAYLAKEDCYFEFEGKTVSGKFIRQILLDGAHRMMFDYDFLCELLEDIGFRNIKRVNFLESDYFEKNHLMQMDRHKDQTLFVECVKGLD